MSGVTLTLDQLSAISDTILELRKKGIFIELPEPIDTEPLSSAPVDMTIQTVGDHFSIYIGERQYVFHQKSKMWMEDKGNVMWSVPLQVRELLNSWVRRDEAAKALQRHNEALIENNKNFAVNAQMLDKRITELDARIAEKDTTIHELKNVVAQSRVDDHIRNEAIRELTDREKRLEQREKELYEKMENLKHTLVERDKTIYELTTHGRFCSECEEMKQLNEWMTIEVNMRTYLQDADRMFMIRPSGKLIGVWPPRSNANDNPLGRGATVFAALKHALREVTKQ